MATKLTSRKGHVVLRIADVIGENPRLDHFELGVQPGRMITAVAFFVEQLGWIELIDKATSGDWGHARFVARDKETSVIVQLTELVGSTDILTLADYGHLGLRVSDPLRAANAAADWAHYGGLKNIALEEVPGGKWFVYLNDIFTSPIEFVPKLSGI